MAEERKGILIDRKYRLLEDDIKSGAMGVVYRAEQLDVEGRPQRIVAVKRLRSEISRDEGFARRFLREVSIAMQLRSPHALTVYDSGKDETGQLYYVMEFMPQTLKELLVQGPLPVERAVAIVVQICDALTEAHSLPEPVVHRDIKPANIFVEHVREKERVKLGDFGIAKILSEEGPKITQTGAVMGTARYMAPELWLVGQVIDGRADLYALGVLLYKMLTGMPPFSGPLPVLMNQHLNQPPPPLPESIPLGVQEEVKRLLAKKPNDRPGDALSVQTALEEALEANKRHSVAFHKKRTDGHGETRKSPTVDEVERSTIILPTLLSEITNSVGMKLSLIPAGEFLMGSENGFDNEKPIRKVQISQPFYLSKYPVTQTQWETVMRNNSTRFKDDLSRPVENVSWNDAQEFLRKLNACEGEKTYRLPTEAEWEYACCGGSIGTYCFGDDETKLKEYAWCGVNSEGETHLVG